MPRASSASDVKGSSSQIDEQEAWGTEDEDDSIGEGHSEDEKGRGKKETGSAKNEPQCITCALCSRSSKVECLIPSRAPSDVLFMFISEGVVNQHPAAQLFPCLHEGPQRHARPNKGSWGSPGPISGSLAD